MQQLRLYVKLTKDQAENYFNLLEKTLEDEAYPLAIVEQQEVSVYCNSKQENFITNCLINIDNNLNVIVEKEILPNIDWVQYSLEGLAPVETNNFFIYGNHYKNLAKDNKINIEIEANQAFGSGHHHTTIGCLELLEKTLNSNTTNILDIGTGSGILSIAIAKLQEQRHIDCNIIASDIDPIAIKVAIENFKLNKVEQYITPIVASGLANEDILIKAPYDVIVANILAKPLIELAIDIKNIVNEKTTIILSGILKTQINDVIKAYTKQNFIIKQLLNKDEWVALSLTLN